MRSPTCSLLGLDLGLTLLALHGAKLLRENISWGVYLDQPLEFSPWLYLIVPGVWLVVFAALRVYRPARSLCTVADLPTVGDAIIGASLIFTGIAYLLFRELSRFLFFYFFVLDLCFLSGWRGLALRFSRWAQRLYGVDRCRVLIVGAGPVGQKLAQALSQYSVTNLHLVGFVDDEPNPPGFSRLG